jgi:hypothetical protein
MMRKRLVNIPPSAARQLIFVSYYLENGAAVF